MDKKFYLHEDWATVVVGFLIIILAIAGFLIPIPTTGWSDISSLKSRVFTVDNLLKIFIQFLFLQIAGAIGILLTGRSLRDFTSGFPVIYILTVVALILAGNSQMKALNLEAVIFSLCLGLLVGDYYTLPDWLKNALSTELFVKIGLILLGAGVIFSDILKAGFLGLIQALFVVVSVWYFAYWVCKKLKIDDELTMMISSAVSICGVSAAIATAGAIKGDPKKLSFIISLVLVTAIPMMVIMPYFANYFHFPEAVTGAWLGGTIDTTGAAVASGTLVGETALKISTIVKFSQNVLLGLAAFAISIFWTYKNEEEKKEQNVSLKVIWERFPKFVLGFLAASLIFSFAIPTETTSLVKDNLKNLQGIWFALAFTSIGLETNFKDLLKANSRKPVYAFLISQAFNVVITLGIAFLLFGNS